MQISVKTDRTKPNEKRLRRILHSNQETKSPRRYYYPKDVWIKLWDTQFHSGTPVKLLLLESKTQVIMKPLKLVDFSTPFFHTRKE